MPSAAKSPKVACTNPNTGRVMNIDKAIYDRVYKAIYQVLKKSPKLSFTELCDGVNECLKSSGHPFKGSISWYTISVKHDMEVRGIVVVTEEKGRKYNSLRKGA